MLWCSGIHSVMSQSATSHLVMCWKETFLDTPMIDKREPKYDMPELCSCSSANMPQWYAVTWVPLSC